MFAEIGLQDITLHHVVSLGLLASIMYVIIMGMLMPKPRAGDTSVDRVFIFVYCCAWTFVLILGIILAAAELVLFHQVK